MASAKGGCMCGAVRYECNAQPVFMANCHCRDCQRATGTAYFPTLVVPRSAVKISGEPKYYESAGGSGKRIKRGFCANCGSRLFALPELIPDMMGIPAASLDDPGIFKPSLDFFTGSAQPWHQMDPALPKYPTNPLDPNYDPDHSHSAFVAMCDPDPAGVCRNDGAGDEACFSTFFTCPPNAAFVYVDNSHGAVNPYLELATQYGWANYMFQTNQGPSFPAHQYLFGGTSAPTAPDDRAGIFAAENGSNLTNFGCVSAEDVGVELIDPTGEENALTYPCFEHQGIADLLPGNITWRYYTPPGPAIWNAPIAIAHICQSSAGGHCTGKEWFKNVDLNPPHVLRDIRDCNLRSLSWVVPSGGNSDHPGGGDKYGPSWVASIVNAIGNSNRCDNNTGYWKNTAVLITWDDWGGWYDHERPPILSSVQRDYERGFRVPLIVVSAHTPRRYIENGHLDFGSLLLFVEQNFNIAAGALGFADARSSGNLDGFFNLSAPPRTYRTIAAPKSASFFLNDKRPMTAPDDD